MGCENTKEDLETKMLMLKIKRVAIKQKRQKKIERLEKLTGEKILIEPLPDYLEDNDDIVQTNKENKKIEQKENIFKKKNDYDFGDDDDN